MTDDVRDILPALSAEEWAKREIRRSDADVTVWARIEPVVGLQVEFVYGGSYGAKDVANIAAIIALANAAMNDEDPRKFTRATVDALRLLLDFCHEKHVGFGGWYEEHAAALPPVDDLADAIESYLPPSAT